MILWKQIIMINNNTFALFAINQAIQGEVSVFSPLTRSPCLSKKCKSFVISNIETKLVQ